MTTAPVQSDTPEKRFEVLEQLGLDYVARRKNWRLIDEDQRRFMVSGAVGIVMTKYGEKPFVEQRKLLYPILENERADYCRKLPPVPVDPSTMGDVGAKASEEPAPEAATYISLGADMMPHSATLALPNGGSITTEDKVRIAAWIVLNGQTGRGVNHVGKKADRVAYAAELLGVSKREILSMLKG